MIQADSQLIIEHLTEPQTVAALMLRFEIALLEELGFGLDLSQCAATGQTHDLVYVSPKTGRAVSREAGAPWHDKLLVLPAFLVEEGGAEGAEELREAFRLTGYFLARNVFGPRGIKEPEARHGLLAALAKDGLRPLPNLPAEE